VGREIKLEAGSRLNAEVLRPKATPTIASWRLPSSDANAWPKRAAGPFALDAVVENAIEAGYRGTVERADSILRREGGFIVEPGPSGRLVMRRADSPTLSVEVDFPNG